MSSKVDSGLPHFDVEAALLHGKNQVSGLFARRDQEELKEETRRARDVEKEKRLVEWTVRMIDTLSIISEKMGAHDPRLQFSLTEDRSKWQVVAHCSKLGGIRILVYPDRIAAHCAPIDELRVDLCDPKFPDHNKVVQGLEGITHFEAADPDETISLIVAYLQDHWLPQRAALDAFNQRV